MVQPDIIGKYLHSHVEHDFDFKKILAYCHYCRAALASMTLLTEDRSGRRSNSPQHYHQQHLSTISTTSGLGSNFTTNTSAMLSSSLGSNNTQPPTPSPRRKISASSFNDNMDCSDMRDNSTPPPPRLFESRMGIAPPMYAPSDYLTRGPCLSNDGGGYGNVTGYRGATYFGK